MAASFATAGDLAVRLKRPVWTGDDLVQVEQFLADASADLRHEIGWQVWPPVEVTVTAQPDTTGHIYLPGFPIAAVTSVVDHDDVTLATDAYELHNRGLHIYASGLMHVTYTVGYDDPPEILVKWACVLAAQALARATTGTLGATPSSESLGDDYRISYSNLQQSGDLPIPERALHRLRSTFGQAVYVT